jgi:hypothetical protein
VGLEQEREEGWKEKGRRWEVGREGGTPREGCEEERAPSGGAGKGPEGAAT